MPPFLAGNMKCNNLLIALTEQFKYISQIRFSESGKSNDDVKFYVLRPLGWIRRHFQEIHVFPSKNGSAKVKWLSDSKFDVSNRLLDPKNHVNNKYILNFPVS